MCFACKVRDKISAHFILSACNLQTPEHGTTTPHNDGTLILFTHHF